MRRALTIPASLLLLAWTPRDPSLDLGRGRPGDILYVHHAPDPVNVRTRNFYLPVQDYYLSCFAFPLEVYRSYNSVSTRNGSFGKGWTFNYDVQIVVGEGAGMKVIEADGFLNEYVPVESESGDRTEQIARIVAAKRKEDAKYAGKAEGKGKAFYDDFEKQLRDDLSFFERQRRLYLGKDELTSASGKYVSRQRGTTFLEKLGTGYLRTTESGRREEYNEKGLLTRISERNDNELRFVYGAQSRLTRVDDGCGQWLQFSYNAPGKIIEVRDSLARKLAYEYDPQDRLITAIDLEQEKTRFSYDKANRMTSLTFSDGSKTEIVYDAKSGQVTKQVGPGNKVTTYKYGRDKETAWALVEDNEGTKNRYEYNESANKIVFIDKTGKKVTTIVNACCGKPLSIKDEKGVGDTFKYDEKGNLVERADASKKTTKFKYEPRFNLPSEIGDPDGTTMRYVYDQKGNLTFARNSSGSHVKLTYEAHGKIATMIDHRDILITFTYNPFGRPTRIEKKLKEKRVGLIDVTYDRTGEIQRVDYDPKNPEVVQEIRETLAGFLRLLKPTGIDFEI